MSRTRSRSSIGCARPDVTERWLLDQNFPKPVFENIAELDRSSQFEHFSDVTPDLAEVSTPDFMVYLVAEARGFAGVVTRDLSQLEDDDSLVTLTRLTISVVTWRRGVDDALVLWGQLLAYMPQVRRLLGPSSVPKSTTGTETSPAFSTTDNPERRTRAHQRRLPT